MPELAALTSAISEVYRYRIRADHLGSTDLRTLQNWIMERQIKTVPGVADVVSFGGAIKTYEVQPDLMKMRDYKISIGQLCRGAWQIKFKCRWRLCRTRPPAIPDSRDRFAAIGGGH